MTADELREFAAKVVRILYLVHDEENDPPVLDSANEWDQGTIERVAEEVDAAGLHPEKVAAFRPAAPVGDRPELSFDGFGINGPDEYRSRIATFTKREDGTTAGAHYGPLFAAAPELMAALRELQGAVQAHRERITIANLNRLCDAEDAALAAIAKAGRQP